jgi:hypothetical protein
MGPARQDLWALAGAGALVLIAALAAQLLMDGGRSSPSAPASVPGDSLAAIDPGTNRVVAEFPVGDTPTSVSVGAGAAWTLSADEQTVSRVDPQTETVKTFATVRSRSTWRPGAMRSGSCKARSPEHTARATTR